jgi:hypothetical protein
MTKKLSSSNLAVLVLGMVACACNSGHWVDGDPMISAIACDAKELAAANKDPAARGGLKADAQAICRNAGMAYTGDLRCEDGSGQVKCK